MKAGMNAVMECVHIANCFVLVEYEAYEGMNALFLEKRLCT